MSEWHARTTEHVYGRPVVRYADRFSCDGHCLPLTKLLDDQLDCQYECVEPGLQAQCREGKGKLVLSGGWSRENLAEVGVLERRILEPYARQCAKHQAMGTPHVRCAVTVGAKTAEHCVAAEKVHDGVADCEDGSDEGKIIRSGEQNCAFRFGKGVLHKKNQRTPYQNFPNPFSLAIALFTIFCEREKTNFIADFQIHARCDARQECKRGFDVCVNLHGEPRPYCGCSADNANAAVCAHAGLRG